MVSTAVFGVCATCRILRVSHTFEHTFWGGVLYHLAYLSPCIRVYVRGISPSGRIFQIPTVWSNMSTRIPKWYLLISFGYELVAIPHGNASIICGTSYHVWDLPSVIICDDVAKDPSDRLSPLTSAKSYISESRYSARNFLANIPWPMTLAPTNEAISCEITRKKNLLGKKIAV